VGSGHPHALYIHEHTPLHRLSPEAKIVGALGIVIPVAITPRYEVWAFAIYAVAILGVLRAGKVPLRFVGARLLALTPFILFAFFIPFVASGEVIEVLGLDVSIDGLWGTWNILAKAVLGATVSIALTATTEVPDLIRGFGILRVPPVLGSIAIFMIRYLQLISDEVGRTRVAMTSRGYDPRWLAQAHRIFGRRTIREVI
jgi:cobalt/nickel transport system permease protein